MDVVDEIMALWRGLPEDDDAARTAFARVYADPVVVNGTAVSLDALLGRARDLQQGLTGITHELLERVEREDKLVIAFVLHGRHTGPLGTPLGQVPPTGRSVTIRGMDVLTFTEGRIAAITVVSDELGLLTQLDAVHLSRPATP